MLLFLELRSLDKKNLTKIKKNLKKTDLAACVTDLKSLTIAIFHSLKQGTTSEKILNHYKSHDRWLQYEILHYIKSLPLEK